MSSISIWVDGHLIMPWLYVCVCVYVCAWSVRCERSVCGQGAGESVQRLGQPHREWTLCCRVDIGTKMQRSLWVWLWVGWARTVGWIGASGSHHRITHRLVVTARRDGSSDADSGPVRVHIHIRILAHTAAGTACHEAALQVNFSSSTRQVCCLSIGQLRTLEWSTLGRAWPVLSSADGQD